MLECTVGYFPASYDVVNKSGLQCGILCTPLSEGVTVPVVNFGTSEVVRCQACRGYVNPYSQFINGGRQWKCNLCDKTNETIKDYFMSLDSNGHRLDVMQRPELHSYDYEIEAPEEYCRRVPQSPCYVFVINANHRCMESNALSIICDNISYSLQSVENERTMVGFVIYHANIDIYSFANKKISIYSIRDAEDEILPCPAEYLLYNWKDCKDLMIELLQTIPEMYSGLISHNDKTQSNNCLGTAVKCALEMAKPIGGKIVVFSYGPPTIGLGKISARDKDPKFTDTEGSDYSKVYSLLLKRDHDYYLDMGLMMVKYQLSMDLFQFCDGEYCDITTLKETCRVTGGQVRLWNRFLYALHGESLAADLRRVLTRETGWEAVMRIRVSKGLQIKHYYGSFHKREGDLLEIPTIDCDKSIGALLVHSASVSIQNMEMYVQSALLYTSTQGRRRIRVSNLRVPISSTISQIYNHINLHTMTALIAKQAAAKMFSIEVAAARNHIQDTCLNALHGVVTYTEHRSLTREVDYPESVRFWPLNTLGLLKSLAFADVRDVSKWVSIDTRTALLMDILSMSSLQLDLMIRPSLFLLSQIYEDEQVGQMTSDGQVIPPRELPLSLSAISPQDIVLLDNGQDLLMRVSKDVPSTILSELFGVTSLVGGVSLILKPKPNEPSEFQLSALSRVWAILDSLRLGKYRYQSLRVFAEGSPFDHAFITIYLIKDRTQSVMNYQEFFQYINEYSMRPLEPKTTK